MLRESMTLKQLQEELKKFPEDEQLKHMVTIKERNHGQPVWEILRDAHN